MSELSTNKITPSTGTTVTFGESGDIIALGTGATAVGFDTGVITRDANDPAIDTNPSRGVGTLWLNTTSGCLFACTDATTDANVWVNIANCTTDNINSSVGEAWIQGGINGGVPQTGNLIYFSLSSDSHQVVGTPTSWGGISPLNTGVDGTAAVASSTEGFFLGCHLGGSIGIQDITQKFSFASATDSANPVTFTHVGDSGGAFFSNNSSGSGVSDVSGGNGYVRGGRDSTGGFTITATRKIQFSTGTVISNVASLTQATTDITGNANSTFALWMGGNKQQIGQVSSLDNVDRFSFASDSQEFDHATLAESRRGASGSSSTTHAYIYGGNEFILNNNGTVNAINLRTTIERVAYASSNSQQNHGDVEKAVQSASGAQNNTHGFSVGGTDGTQTDVDGTANGPALSEITTYAFESNTKATIIGDLGITSISGTGIQIPNIV